MEKLKLTKVFDPSELPIRKGVYQVLVRGNEWYSYWAGKYWCITCFYPDHAQLEKVDMSHDCYSKDFIGWRGLAEKP